MKKLFLLVALIISSLTVAQSLDSYRYALIPSRFSIFKNDDQYRLNVLTKLFMQKYGFETYLESDDQPLDFKNTNCNKVFVDITQNNTMFVTKVTVIIKDCSGKIIASSEEGTSREKDLIIAYNDALRKAFNSFPALINHKYTPNSTEQLQEKTVLAEEKNVPKGQEVIGEMQMTAVSTSELKKSTLFAQPIQNGFQLINSEPKVIYKIYKTSDAQSFIAFKDSTQGVLVAKNGQWFFEYYQNNQLVSEKVDVKL